VNGRMDTANVIADADRKQASRPKTMRNMGGQKESHSDMYLGTIREP